MSKKTPVAVLLDLFHMAGRLDLSPQEIAMAGYLLARSLRDFVTPPIYRKEIARDFGVDRRTASRWIWSLRDKSLVAILEHIETVSTPEGDLYDSSCRYDMNALARHFDVPYQDVPEGREFYFGDKSGPFLKMGDQTFKSIDGSYTRPSHREFFEPVILRPVPKRRRET